MSMQEFVIWVRVWRATQVQAQTRNSDRLTACDQSFPQDLYPRETSITTWLRGLGNGEVTPTESSLFSALVSLFDFVCHCGTRRHEQKKTYERFGIDPEDVNRWQACYGREDRKIDPNPICETDREFTLFWLPPPRRFVEGKRRVGFNHIANTPLKQPVQSLVFLAMAVLLWRGEHFAVCVCFCFVWLETEPKNQTPGVFTEAPSF